MKVGYLLPLTDRRPEIRPGDHIVACDSYKGVLRPIASDEAALHVGSGGLLERIWVDQMNHREEGEWSYFDTDASRAAQFANAYTQAGLPCEVVEVRLCATLEEGVACVQ